MRPEHKSSGDEVDAFSAWRHVMGWVQRPGVRKKIKRLSHKKDRQVGKRRAGEGA